nr:uncharacterized protein LOC119161481 isoform X4 [Rhipicephalus microplus]
MDDAAEMTPQTTSSAGGGGNDFQNFEETHQLLHPLSHHTQVTHPPSSSPSHSSSRKSSKKKSHRKRRQGSVSQSVADSKYSTNSPSSSTVNDEILVPLTVTCDGAIGETSKHFFNSMATASDKKCTATCWTSRQRISHILVLSVGCQRSPFTGASHFFPALAVTREAKHSPTYRM